MAMQRSTSGKRIVTLKKRKPPADEPPQEMTQSSPPTAPPMAEEVRQRMTAEAAYYRAQKRGFARGCELEDWLAAEAEISMATTDQQSPPAELH